MSSFGLIYFLLDATLGVQCTVTCGDGLIKRDVVCMKKLGSILAVVSQENCVADDKPATEQQCERPACEPRWYMTDWSQACLLSTLSSLDHNFLCLRHRRRW